MKVNALKPRVLVSKVRKSISDLECLNCLHGHNIRALWKEHPYPIPLTLSPKPSTQVKAFLWEDNGVTQLDRICSSVLWSERVFKEHQCSNAATFPVYKPPATLPGMVSGLRTKRGKSIWPDGQQSSLTNTLSTNPESGGPREKGHLGGPASWGVWEALSYC